MDLERIGAANLRTVRELMERAPSAFAWWLQAAEFYANPVKQIVIVGEKEHPATIAMFREVRNGFNPDRIVAHLDPTDSDDARVSLPLFEGRKMIDGLPTAYVCRNYVCDLPVTDVVSLGAQLENGN